MPLPANYITTRLTTPVELVPPHTDGFYTDAGVRMPASVGHILSKSWVDPSALDDNGIVTSHAGASSAGTTTHTPNGALAASGVATLTPARNVVITVTHASSVVAMSGTITGTRLGRTVTEAWAVTATGTSKVFTGLKAFDTVTSITETVAANASANTIIVGDGNTLGLDFRAISVRLVAEEVDGALPTAGVIVKGSSASTADARGTYTPNSAPNGARDYQVWYLSDGVLYP